MLIFVDPQTAKDFLGPATNTAIQSQRHLEALMTFLFDNQLPHNLKHQFFASLFQLQQFEGELCPAEFRGGWERCGVGGRVAMLEEEGVGGCVVFLVEEVKEVGVLLDE